MAWVTAETGLAADEVRERRQAGKINELPPTSGRSVADIIRANVFTRINAILAILFAVVLYTGSVVNGAFGLLILANSAVGIIQELRAKRTLDRLSIIGRAKPMVIRDGAKPKEIDREQIVVDDLIAVGPGDQIVVDGIVRHARNLAVDESSLTGESDPVYKSDGDTVYSGSSIVAGDARYQATKVGAEAYAAKLAAEASKFTLTDSQLFAGINTILRYITWILIPVAALAIYTQLFRSGSSINDALLAMVASLVPMVPEGLVLMTTIAFALGVIRLGRRNVLVNELPAIEGLARVDIVCADKTGTLTENVMRLDHIEVIGSHGIGESESVSGESSNRDLVPNSGLKQVLYDLCTLDERPNSTARAILAALADDVKTESDAARLADSMPFTSAKKWSGLTYADNLLGVSDDLGTDDLALRNAGGTWVMGAPDVLADSTAPGMNRANELMSQGMRVILLGNTSLSLSEIPDNPQPADSVVKPVALLVLGQTVRSDAAATIDYFAHEGVEVKVISGDNAKAVGAVGRELELDGAENPIDARTLPQCADGKPSEEFAHAVEEGRIFGRVTAQHKRNMVRGLRRKGHHVAMTGDGVNDVLALKEANLGVAMGDGAPATRSVAQLVLLDNRFSVLPDVVAEGRRVIGNIERVANLFLTKTIYSVVLALTVGILGMEYPFEPIHVTVTGWFTIGIPAFVLSLAPNLERAREGFVRRVLRLAVPAGLTVGILTFLFWLWAYPGVDAAADVKGEASTATLIVLIVSAYWVLAVVARPYQWWKILLLAAAAAAYIFIFSVPPVAAALHLHQVGIALLIPALCVGVLGAGIVEIEWRVLRRTAQG